jgi:hypothetical protein
MKRSSVVKDSGAKAAVPPASWQLQQLLWRTRRAREKRVPGSLEGVGEGVELGVGEGVELGVGEGVELGVGVADGLGVSEGEGLAAGGGPGTRGSSMLPWQPAPRSASKTRRR